MTEQLLSWNVNGIRAAQKKGFTAWLKEASPFLLGVQETKAMPDQLDAELTAPEGYTAYWASAEKKGYSGVGVFAKKEPLEVWRGFKKNEIHPEGRILVLRYPSFVFTNIYFPNGGASVERLRYKLDFYARFLAFSKGLIAKGDTLLVCGDFNTAHTALDLKNAKANEKNSGFLPEERAWLDKFIDAGFTDTFRRFNQEGGNYTWWDMKTAARSRNVGWRLDYFMAANAGKRIKNAFILKEVQGSDHCPIGVDFDLQ